MYHPPSRRKQIIQRTVTYTVMSIAVVTLVTALVFVMLGYQFNQNDGRIEQGGLVQFDSRPSGANITIDGNGFGTRTPSKTTAIAGEHFITMQRDGYKRWQKSVNVVPGSVLWLNYARLVPTELKQTNVADFETVSSTSVSPDSQQMAIKERPDDPIIRLADLTEDTVKIENIELPASSFTSPQPGKTQQFELMKWDADSRFMIVRHIYDDNKLEWLVVDTDNPKESQNLTKLLDIGASRVVFSGNDDAILYAQVGGDVRRIDRKAETISRPLVTNVEEFAVYKEATIVFTTLLDKETKKRSVGYFSGSSNKLFTIKTFEDDGKKLLRLALGEYFGDTYVALAYGDTISIRTGDLSKPMELKEVASLPFKGGAAYLSTGTKGRFVTAQSDATYTVYDMEIKKQSTTTLQGKGAVKKQLGWLDGYMLWSDRGGMLRMYEFDGTNQHEIMAVAPGFSASLSPNSRYLYGITKAGDQYHLGRVRMILP